MAVLFTTAIIVTVISCVSACNVGSVGNASKYFSANLYRELSKEQGDVLVSPASLQQVLGLLLYGAANRTKAELAKALCYPLDYENLYNYLNAVPNALLGKPSVDVSLASAIYARNDIAIHPNFIDAAIKLHASIRQLQTNSDASVAEINDWFNQSTHGLLGNVLKYGDITADTALILVNALYFKGRWLDASFLEKDTHPAKFYRKNQVPVSVDMMRCTDNFNVGRDLTLNATYLELDYVGGEFALIIVLPDEVDGLRRLQDNIHRVLSPEPFHPEQIDIRLPRFRASASVRLRPILERLGVREAFGNADLAGLTAQGKQLAVSDVVHNTLLEVNEKGTEAAAASAAGIVDRIFSPPIPFNADHPFLYYLQHKPSGIILFIGHYSGGH